MQRARIVPSILSANLCNLGRDLQSLVEVGMKQVHVDVMDGHFVPNLSFGSCIVESIRQSFPQLEIDVHLMLQDPEGFVDSFIQAGATQCTFHVESNVDRPDRLIQYILKRNVNVGLAINPSTSVGEIVSLIQHHPIDTLLVMSVDPGFGGQEFLPSTVPKIKAIRQRFPLLTIQVDGGINHKTVTLPVQAGANSIVAGSAVFKSASIPASFTQLQQLLR